MRGRWYMVGYMHCSLPQDSAFELFFGSAIFLTGALLFERTGMEKTDEPRHMLPCCKAWACVLQQKGEETICLYFDMSMY